MGKNPLEIDTIYTNLGVGERNLSGTRTEGTSHSLMRAASGIEMALWDLSGKLLGQPVTTLLGGRFRAPDVRSILAIGPAAPEPAVAGDSVIVELPTAEVRSFDAYRIEGLA